jgi:hypothetical protein
MNLNFILAKTLQFATFLFFIFMVLVYFGLVLMLALAVLWYSTKVITLIGLPALIAVAVGIAALGYVGLTLSRMPQLYSLVLEIGLELVNFGQAQVKRFDPIIEKAANR